VAPRVIMRCIMSEQPPATPLRILHLEDSLPDHQLATRALVKAGLAGVLTRVDRLDEFARLLQRDESFDVVLADHQLLGFTAVDAWQATADMAHKPPFILLSGAIGERAAVEAIKRGFADYLSKSDLPRLGPVILRAIEVHHTRLAKEKADADLLASEKHLAVFSGHLQRAIEKERAAIAREIHDDVGGALAAIGFDLGWITRHSADEATLEHARQANSMLQQAISASQAIMMNLRPPILDQGLVAALEWLCSGFERRSGIRTALACHAYANVVAPQFARSIELVAYRTAQEALTNIAKHANCKSVKVELSDAGGTLTLEITDNGCGISDVALEKPKSFGLKGLSERARTVGGWLDISTRATPLGLDSPGTAIILSVPLHALEETLDSAFQDSLFLPTEGLQP
jgi:signal transduction histidine kinase